MVVYLSVVDAQDLPGCRHERLCATGRQVVDREAVVRYRVPARGCGGRLIRAPVRDTAKNSLDPPPITRSLRSDNIFLFINVYLLSTATLKPGFASDKKPAWLPLTRQKQAVTGFPLYGSQGLLHLEAALDGRLHWDDVTRQWCSHGVCLFSS